MPIPNADNYYGRYRKAMAHIRGRDMTRDEFNKQFVGHSDLTMLEAMLDDPEADRAYGAQQWALENRAKIEKQVKDQQTEITGLQKQVESLKAQVGDNSKWETLKALVRELVGKD
jgi:hypothetical protein